ncbi:MAG: hypothetical protein JNM09_01000 [Blastocatellia bacterium]|nr:hypothetical protein [Blastocatellia bacterium]
MTRLQQRLTKLKEEGYEIIFFLEETTDTRTVTEILAQAKQPGQDGISFLAENTDGERDRPIVKVEPGKASVLLQKPDKFSAKFKEKIASLFRLATRATETTRFFGQIMTTRSVVITNQEWIEIGARARQLYLAWHCGENQPLRALSELQQTTFLIPIEVLPEIQVIGATHRTQRAQAITPRDFRIIAPPPEPPPKRRRRRRKIEESGACLCIQIHEALMLFTLENLPQAAI